MTQAWNAQSIKEWWNANPGKRFDLSGLDLAGTNLTGASLTGAGLTGMYQGTKNWLTCMIGWPGPGGHHD